MPPTLHWIGDADGHLRMIDQTKLPNELVEIDCHTVEEVWQAIKRLSVRGAPAIGVAAAYGVCLAAESGSRDEIEKACDYLATSRPTAVNLFWSLDRMRAIAQRDASMETLLAEARAIHEEDAAMCLAIGRHGADLLAPLFEEATSEPVNLLTHCNAGALATGGVGTALEVIFELARRHSIHVWVDETRPLLQGSRLTAWELMQRDIPCTLICDNMAGHVMQQGRVQAVVTGADRIAANGDAANKIGTYAVAALAKAHDIPFYIAAPTSTIDANIVNGTKIPIEEREAEEVTNGFGRATAPEGVNVYNPAFDVTPAELISGWITEERGMVEFECEKSR